jgi:hypothetical protein
MENIIFLGYVVSVKGIKIDEENVRAIQECLAPKSITKARNFYGFTNSYRIFVKDFSTLVAT